jgi:hypothetical protein
MSASSRCRKQPEHSYPGNERRDHPIAIGRVIISSADASDRKLRFSRFGGVLTRPPSAGIGEKPSPRTQGEFCRLRPAGGRNSFSLQLNGPSLKTHML